LSVADTSAPDQLLERAAELDAIDAAMRSAISGGGRLLVIEGPAGIGKSALLTMAQRRALASGMRVLTARGGELEREFGFGVVGQLFQAAVLKNPETLVAGRARLAATVLGLDGGDEDAASSADAIFPALQGLYWLTVNLAEQQPLALLLDDVHLADAASLRFVSYLGQRLEGLPLLVLAATRSGPDADPVFAALQPTDVLRPPPLTESGTEALVRTIAPEAGSRLCRACHEATGGNALFVRELARAVHDENSAGRSVAAERVLSWSPEGVTRSMSARLTRLPAAARQLAHAVAVLGQDATLRHAALLARLEATTADSSADRLRAAGILTAAGGVDFVHPIVRAAITDEIPSAARARAHADAASLLAAEGAPSERVAVHIMRSEPGAGLAAACATLTEAARQALVRGAPEAAAAYLRRALEEPALAGQRAELLLELAACQGRIFELDAAADNVRRGYEAAGDRDTRLRAALLAAALAGHNGRANEAIGLLDAVRGEFADRPEVTTSVQAHIANAARFERDTRISSLSISQALCREDGGDSDATVLAAAAAELAMAGRPAEQVARVAERGLAALDDERLVGSAVHLILIRTLLVSDRFEASGRALDGLLEESRRSGSVLDFAIASLFRADLMYRRGDVFESEADARAAHGLMLERRSPMTPAIVAHLLNALVERGELAEAESVLASADLTGPPDELPSPYIANLFLLARGRLRAASADPASALEDLLECGRRQEAWREHNPALIPWRSDAALAYLALGQRGEAIRLANEEIELARRFGAARAIGIALRAAATVTEGDPGLALAREAVAVLSDSGARLEHARARADLGERLRDSASRGECRTFLREALELAHVSGAIALERRVLASLRQTGARPRQRRLSGPEALTPGERRVAQMAANGLTNREIAEALFLTVRTIEFHLLNAYRKLRISGRRELRGVLAGNRPAQVRPHSPTEPRDHLRSAPAPR
jgi:DNA-binding CsgD family transcriptional regulator